jgi:hypothetical protein
MKYLLSSISLGTLMVVWALIFLILNTFDERISWRTYTSIRLTTADRPLSVNWRPIVILVLLPICLSSIAYILGYLVLAN